MSKLVVVAIPAQDDSIWKVSSEKVPHMTILFLGDAENNPNLGAIAAFVQHAANLTLKRFGLDVDRRGTLGSDEADVLFFENNWEMPALRAFQGQLLQNDTIRRAFDSVEQFPGWTPHLTLGYPETPAKETENGPRNWVTFDRIALWYGNYEGPEFLLKTDSPEVSMSSTDPAAAAVDNFLAHYGKKGMKWGVRKGKGAPTAVAVQEKGKKLKTSGGKNLPAAPEAVAAAKLGQKARASGVKALSNTELSTLSNRLNLEQNVTRLQSQNDGSAKQFVRNLLSNAGKQQATRAANNLAAKQVDNLLAKQG